LSGNRTIAILDSPDYIHHLGETGNVKHVVNLVGNIRDRKAVLSDGSATDQTKSQKGRGNKHDIGKIEN